MEGLALELAVEAVKFMVENVMQRLREQNNLILDSPSQVGELENDLESLKEYLEDAVKGDRLITRTLIREVRDSVYKAEDAMDFVVEVTEKNTKWFSGAKSKSKRANIASVIKSVAEKVKKIREKVECHIGNTGHSTNDVGGGLGEYEGPPGKQKYAPIFEQEEKTLRGCLTQEAQQPEVIFVTGAHGIGKTTLAAKMFHDSDIREQFTKHIWIRVSNPTARNIFLVILRQLNELLDQGPFSQNNWELSQRVASCLQGHKLLLVLDNVSKIDDWERLWSTLEGIGNGSKVLITSNNDGMARTTLQPEPQTIKLNPLSCNESWSMLQLRVFAKIECPPELVNDGKLIAGHCNGLPQAIVFAGENLAERDSETYRMNQRQKIWKEFSLGLVTYFNDGIGAHNASIMSSYNNLPYHLRACFLYLAIFPEKSTFSVSKLIRMWIAEGFIRPNGDAALEKIAEHYLTYLIDRNLVIVEEKRPDGSAKTCSMSALLYDFCKIQAGYERENFLQEFKKCSSDGVFNPPIKNVEKYRRVCIHAHISNFLPNLISSENDSLLRSFVSHANELLSLDKGVISNIRATFKILRVLDAKPMKFDTIDSGLCKLVYLRFVTLSLNGDVLPATISKLRNIQTLIIHTSSRTLKIEANILEMDELRHFKTNASATLLEKIKASKEDERLQTLCGISPKSCTQEFFNKAPNLKKLSIHGQLALLLDDKNKPLTKLVNVEKLKLHNEVIDPKYEGKPSSQLLEPSRLPPSLKRLTLSATCLDWEHISILGLLQNLEELKLKDNAFVGEKWEVLDKDCFHHLQTLHFEGLQFEQWKCSSPQFPKLTRLTVSECKELREIPVALAEIPTFIELHLRNGSDSAAESARNIRGEKLKMKRTDNSIVFKLSIDDL